MYHNNSDTKENTPYLSIKGVKGGRGQIYLGEIRKNSMEKMELDIGLEDWVAFFFSIIKEIHVYYRKRMEETKEQQQKKTFKPIFLRSQL